MATAIQRGSKRSEFLGVIFFAFTIALFLSLISYNPSDPSFNVITYKERPSNYIGRAGAYLSDVLFQIFGLTAFLLPVALTVLAWKKVRSRNLSSLYFKGLGFFFLLCSIATTLSLLPMLKPPYEVNFPIGGAMGTICSGVLISYFNLVGALIIALTFLTLSLLVCTSFSFVRWTLWIESLPQTLASQYKDWRESNESRKVKKFKDIMTGAPKAAQPVQPMVKTTTQAEHREPPVEPAVKKADMLPIKREPDAATIKPPAPPTIVAPQRLQESAPERKSAEPKPKTFEFPDVNFLTLPPEHAAIGEEELMERAKKITAKFSEFDVYGNVIQIHPGPVVTTFEFKPDAGVKYSRIINLVDDICLAMKAESIRMDRIPGKSTVGIEVPNAQRDIIHLRELIDSDVFRRAQSKLTLALGKLINGEPYVTDLARMPHLLIAGATGTGKSVCLNTMITSILYKATPEEVKFIMIDPKRLELGIYADIPHLLTPIVTEVKAAANALNWAIKEMEDRYKRLAFFSVRNIDQYNAIVRSKKFKEVDVEEDTEPLPYIVVIIDELADLMMLAGREVETSITRLGQMARAVGIHLILSTQRPSVDVITGLIKANFPCRISFRVSSKVDSRTIIDCNGAEQLLGNGDMLFLPPGSARLIRIHGAYVSEKEAGQIIDYLKQQAKPEYDESVLEFDKKEEDEEEFDSRIEDAHDELYDEAIRIVVEMRKASTSVLQRRLKIGYGRAARLLDMMQRDGIVGPPDASRPREVLVDTDYPNRSNDENL